MNKYAVITADIIDSKKYSRLDLQLKPKLTQISSSFLVTPFTLSRGDEIQAVCGAIAQIPTIIRQLRYACRPFQLRVGVGIGSLEDRELVLSSWDMNGEAFFNARNAMEFITKEKLPKTCLRSNHLVVDLAVNTIYLFIDNIMSDWTTAQWEAVHSYEQLRTYVLAAEALGIARQNVQKRCYAAKWHEIKIAEENIGRIIENI